MVLHVGWWLYVWLPAGFECWHHCNPCMHLFLKILRDKKVQWSIKSFRRMVLAESQRDIEDKAQQDTR
jgi:hypothetical protein